MYAFDLLMVVELCTCSAFRVVICFWGDFHHKHGGCANDSCVQSLAEFRPCLLNACFVCMDFLDVMRNPCFLCAVLREDLISFDIFLSFHNDNLLATG